MHPPQGDPSSPFGPPPGPPVSPQGSPPGHPSLVLVVGLLVVVGVLRDVCMYVCACMLSHEQRKPSQVHSDSGSLAEAHAEVAVLPARPNCV